MVSKAYIPEQVISNLGEVGVLLSEGQRVEKLLKSSWIQTIVMDVLFK